jgi:hypothetical protein
MVKVCVVQSDNRPSLDYLLKTQQVNKRFCDILGYDYLFIELENKKYDNLHPATCKIYIVNDFLQNSMCDILVFLDSDAWIHNGYYLDTIINNLVENEEKQGCFSRDPYVKKNTFINSGSFIVKNNDFTKQMYNDIINDLHNNINHSPNGWPYDQYYISKYVFENKVFFVIFIPDILNTPIGKVLKHNWYKNEKMHNDLDELISIITNENFHIDKTIFIEKDYYDEKDFPNTSVDGYEY